jgi:hypothetical protein
MDAQKKLLQDPVWDAITTCWSSKPEQRYELSIVYQVFSKSGQQGAKQGDSSKTTEILQ